MRKATHEPLEGDASPTDQLAADLGRIRVGLEQVESAMREQLASNSLVVGEVGEHTLASGGKRIRPALLFFAAELCGYSGPRCVQVAASVELLHTATLLHDDVVDGSSVRRGRSAANAVWGNRKAVLVGDYLYARASAMIVEDGDAEIQWVFSDTIRRMAEGELLQLARSFDPDITETQYFDVIDRKSAALLAASCEAGAILGQVTRAERRRLAEFGRRVGVAFQLRDDALDYEGGEDALGKRPYTDLLEGKLTLPLLLTLKRCQPAERAQITARLKQLARAHRDDTAAAEPAELEPVLSLVDRHHGVTDTVRRAEDQIQAARAAIAPFPDGPAKRALQAAASFAVARAS